MPLEEDDPSIESKKLLLLNFPALCMVLCGAEDKECESFFVSEFLLQIEPMVNDPSSEVREVFGIVLNGMCNQCTPVQASLYF